MSDQLTVKNKLEKLFTVYRLYNYFSNSDDVKNRERYHSFCDWVNNAVSKLPEKEQFLIKERYLSNEGDYLTDQVGLRKILCK